jgi:hypothetical protein
LGLQAQRMPAGMGGESSGDREQQMAKAGHLLVQQTDPNALSGGSRSDGMSLEVLPGHLSDELEVLVDVEHSEPGEVGGGGHD